MALASPSRAMPWGGRGRLHRLRHLIVTGTRLPKRVTAASKCRLTVPVGPCRCLPMMISALPWARSHLGLPLDVLRRCRDAAPWGYAEVIFLAVHENDHVGVLLDRSRTRAGPRAADVCHRGSRPGATIAMPRGSECSSSLASALRPVVISVTSCTRPSCALRPEPCSNWI